MTLVSTGGRAVQPVDSLRHRLLEPGPPSRRRSGRAGAGDAGDHPRVRGRTAGRHTRVRGRRPPSPCPHLGAWRDAPLTETRPRAKLATGLPRRPTSASLVPGGALLVEV